MDRLAAFADGVLATLAAVDPGWLLVALAAQLGQIVCTACGWRNILLAVYPASRLRRREVVCAYTAGVGLNAVVPARGGDLAVVTILRSRIAGSSTPSVLSAYAVNELFYVVATVPLVAYALVVAADGGGPPVAGGDGVSATSLLVLLAVALALATALVLAVRRRPGALRRAARRFRDGLAALGHPRRYVVRILPWQLLGYAFRFASVLAYLAAFGLPADLRWAALVIGGMAASTALPLTPGGIGVQQAVLVVALRDRVAASTVTAFSLGQQLLSTAFTVALASLALVLAARNPTTRANLAAAWHARRAARERPAPAAGRASALGRR